MGMLLVLGCNGAFALEIVYPKINPVRINAPSTFFIGSINSKDKLKINDAEVKTSELGAFAQVVPLEFGLNKFKIVSGSDSIDFVIERPPLKAAVTNTPTLIEYPTKINFHVEKDGAPLRMTPVDGGINRMAHLSEGVQLQINGEKGDFYRVYLNPKISGWIAKSDVVQCDKCYQPTALKELKTKEDKEFCYWEFDLGAKTPYILKEENGLSLQIFNIEGFADGTYLLNLPVQKFIGYDIFYNNDKLVLKVRKPLIINAGKPLADIKIAVDAGHGGCEYGAIGCCGDKEKDINLAISKELQKELESRGAKIIMTRENDDELSLKDRVKFAKDKEAALLISIHANAIPDGQDPSKNRGTSVYYYHKQAKPLADCILETMTAQLGTQNDKVRQGSLALVRPTASVSVLIEVAYMINPYDYELLLDKDFQKKCAKAIADGIGKFLLQN